MDVIQAIKEKASLVDVVSEYTALRKRGSRLVGLCPLHNEKTPSFSIDEEKQLFHCFGCNTGGDVIAFLMKVEGLSFKQTLAKLCERHGIEYAEGRGATTATPSSSAPAITRPAKREQLFYELDPCPFCGRSLGDVKLITCPCIYVHCYCCSADGPVTATEEGAVELWNRRVPVIAKQEVQT